MPAFMIEKGFDKQILPRFGFKHRLKVEPVTDGEADMALSESEGQEVFREIDGAAWHLDILTEEAEAAGHAATFLEWMRSDPGRAAVESFAPDGAPEFTTEVVVVEVVEEEEFDGDTKTGARLAIVHCGRCHVVDKRNRMGGIGSTPSFGALRGRDNWSDLFRAFYVHNPHPSFTQVDGVTEPFNGDTHVAPVEITLDEIEAITAFVATLTPKDLGRPVQAN